MHNLEKIIICESCKGTGFYNDKTLTNYHHNEHNEELRKCPRCNGFGRVLEQTQISTIFLDEDQLKRKATYG